MINTILLSVAIVILIVNITLTILEAKHYYHVYFPSAAHPGRIRGALVRGPEGDVKTTCTGWVEIDGMKYNVEWHIIRKDRKWIDDGK